MRRRRFGSLTAVLSTTSLALTATALAAYQPATHVPPPAGGTPAAAGPSPSAATRSAGPPASTSSRALPSGCTRGFSVAAHRRYAGRAFRRPTLSRKALRRLSRLRRCQNHGRRGTRAAWRTERKLRRWRSRYHCTQSEVVNCIRGATRIYGGSFAHNLACAQSESRLNPYAHNSGGSGATGLYQFMPTTWSSTLARMHISTAKSIYSAKWQARAAAWKFRHDGFGEWTGAGC
jgi:soluble lytic murein transglycosylase-like protein